MVYLDDLVHQDEDGAVDNHHQVNHGFGNPAPAARPMKISVIGVVREIKHMADIPPITRQKTKTPWFMLSRVMDKENDGRISHSRRYPVPRK